MPVQLSGQPNSFKPKDPLGGPPSGGGVPGSRDRPGCWTHRRQRLEGLQQQHDRGQSHRRGRLKNNYLPDLFDYYITTYVFHFTVMQIDVWIDYKRKLYFFYLSNTFIFLQKVYYGYVQGGEPEPGVFGSLEPELEPFKKNRSRSHLEKKSGAGVEPEPLKN